MKVRLKENGYVIEEISISNLTKSHFMGNNSICFRNFNNQFINIDFQDSLYCLQCSSNGFKNHKNTLSEVKKYIRENVMK